MDIKRDHVTSCKTKRQLYSLSKTYRDEQFLRYFKKYKHILKTIIKKAKIYDNKKRIITAEPKFKPGYMEHNK